MRKRVKTSFAMSALLTGAAVVVVMTAVLGAQSRLVGAALYAAGWVAFIFAVRRHQRSLSLLRSGRGMALGFAARFGRPLSVALLMCAAASVFFTLVPVDEARFVHVDAAQLALDLDDDEAAMLQYRAGLKRLVDGALPGLASQGMALDVEEKERWLRFWAAYVDYAVALDNLVDEHKYFYQIHPVSLARENARSFLIGYAALLTQVSQAVRVREAIGGNVSLEHLFDEARAERGIPAGGYHTIRTGVTSGRTTLRLHAGRLHLKVLQELGYLDGERQRGLVEGLRADYRAFWKALGKQPDMVIDNPLDRLEKNAFVAWFPLQRGIARGMGKVRTTARDNFVSLEQLAALRPTLQPGDIMVERRNWYMTNVGLPGFWPHAALYTGTPEELDAFFADCERIATGGLPPSVYLRAHHPDLLRAYGAPDEEGHAARVIEAIANGVVLTSLEHSGRADYLGVFRANWGKEGRLAALVRAFSFHGRPYDYNFDFVTDDALVCSELVYKSFCTGQRREADRALPFELVPSIRWPWQALIEGWCPLPCGAQTGIADDWEAGFARGSRQAAALTPRHAMPGKGRAPSARPLGDAWRGQSVAAAWAEAVS